MTCSEEYNFDSTITYSVLVAPSKEWLSSPNSWLIIAQVEWHRQLRTAWSAQDSHYYPPSHIPRVISIGELSLSKSLSSSRFTVPFLTQPHPQCNGWGISASIFHKNVDTPGIRRANLSVSEISKTPIKILGLFFGHPIADGSLCQSQSIFDNRRFWERINLLWMTSKYFIKIVGSCIKVLRWHASKNMLFGPEIWWKFRQNNFRVSRI